ncbi:MAG: hemolysin family protein [Marmoricola sp.]
MSTSWALLLSVLLLLGNAYFTASEFALVSSRRSKVEPRAAAGSRTARTTLRALEQLNYVIAAAQLGITVCSLGLGAVAEPTIGHLLEPAVGAMGLSDSVDNVVAFAVTLALVVYFHVVLGEMVPKNVSLAGPERAAMVLGVPMMALVTVLKPAVIALDVTSDAAVRLLRIEPRSSRISSFTLEEVEAMVDESREEGLLEEDEYERLAGALGFTSRTVADVLLPLDRLQTVRRGARVTEVERICAGTGFSRFPVVDHDGELVGYLHIKDVLQPDPHGRATVVEDSWIRPFAAVPAESTLGNALQRLQAKGAHMALVVDRSGTPLGVATLEDLIEELVGEIRDASHAEG